MDGDLLKLEVKNSKMQDRPQNAGEIVINRPNTPGLLPKVNGVNILSNSPGLNIDNMRERLRLTGIEIKYIMFSRFADGNRLIFLYCMSLHGQYVLIEPPPDTKIDFGDIELATQRIGIIQSSILDTFKEELKNIYTNYAFINSTGIQYVKKDESIIYEFDNYETTKRMLDLKKYHYIIIPAVPFANLIEPARLNTIEAFLNVIDKDETAKELINRAGLTTLLTMKGPFTFFLPKKEKLASLKVLSVEKLKAVLLAHIVIGRIETQEHRSIGKEEIKLQAIAQNEITIIKNDGKIDLVISGTKKSKILGTIKKYNGIIYIIDTIFYPLTENFKLPEKSDLDDVITIFDINRSTMEIRRAQYVINRHNQEQVLHVLDFARDSIEKLHDEINEKSKIEGDKLLKDSNEFVELFYSRDIPCEDQCVKLDEVARVVRQENMDFELLLRMSNSLAAFKIPVEHLYKKALKIDQRLHVKNLINTGTGIINDDDQEDEE